MLIASRTRRQGGKHHEIEVIGRAGGGRGPAALRQCGGLAQLGAGLPQPSGQDRDRLLAVRRDRRARPVHRPASQRNVGPAGRGGEPPRRQRQHRRGGGVHGAARRLHAAFRRADARRQRDAVADHGVRSGDELRADHAGRHRAGGVHGRGADAVQVDQRGDRLRQGQSGQAELRLGRHRLERASRHRAVQRRGRHPDAARALQPDVAGHHRRADRPHRGLVHHVQRAAAAHQERRGARLRGDRPEARGAAA